MANQRRRGAAGALFLGLALGGCGSAGPTASIDVVPPQKALQIVNANAAKITGALRASGSVDGYFTTPENRRRSYHADAVLFYLAPGYFRFDVKSLGDRQLLLGSNTEYFWFYSKQDDAYYCGRQGVDEDVPEGVPMRADQVIDALALAPIDHSDFGAVGSNESERFQLRKEYLSDGGSPPVIKQVVFRDQAGTVTMKSSLDRYKPLYPGGPLLPTSMVAQWPTARAQMRFRVSKWTPADQVSPEGPQFATPPECSSSRRGGSTAGN